MPGRKLIEQRAYQIWEQAGRPWGWQEEHWTQACQECGDLDGEIAASINAPDAFPSVAELDRNEAVPDQSANVGASINTPLRPGTSLAD